MLEVGQNWNWTSHFVRWQWPNFANPTKRLYFFEQSLVASFETIMLHGNKYLQNLAKQLIYLDNIQTSIKYLWFLEAWLLKTDYDFICEACSPAYFYVRRFMLDLPYGSVVVPCKKYRSMNTIKCYYWS